MLVLLCTLSSLPGYGVHKSLDQLECMGWTITWASQKISCMGILTATSLVLDIIGGMLKLKNPLPCYVVSSMSHAAPCVASSMLQAQFCADT